MNDVHTGDDIRSSIRKAGVLLDYTMSERGKKHFLTISQRIKLIDSVRKGARIPRASKLFDVSVTQVRNVMKNEKTIREQWHRGISSQRKTLTGRKCTFYDINENVYAWFLDMREKNIPITGPLLQQKAVKIGFESGLKGESRLVEEVSRTVRHIISFSVW